jgi:hypothetical protein
MFEAEYSTKDKQVKKKVVQNACRLLGEIYDPDECSAAIATRVHKLVYETLGDDDPYSDLKTKSNKIALSLVPRVEKLVRESDDPLRTSILCSIIGNMMDFGIRGGSSNPDNLKDIFNRLFEEGLGFDDTDKVKNILKESKNVVLFTDNCGEIVFDKILCREIKKFKPDVFLTLVVKGEPVLSDATMDEAVELGFDEVVDEILTTGCFAVGADLKNPPLDLKKTLDEVDLIICKGMANYEVFSETDYKPIVYFLRTKCHPIANSMGLSVDISAVKLYQ